MFDRIAVLFVAVLFVAAVHARPGFAAPIEWWTTHSLDKVFPDSVRPAEAGQAIHLKAARNETEDAQVIIRVPRGVEISRAAYALPDLEGDQGARLSQENLSAFWVWYTYVLNNPKDNTDPATYLRKAPAFFPDAFLEQSEIRIRDEWTQPLWVSVHVPEGTPAGEYRGVLFVSLTDGKGETTLIDVPITVMVWPFTLPRELHLHHTEWFFVDPLLRYYRIEPWSDECWQWVAKVAHNMAQHRQDTILTPFWALVAVRQDSSDSLECDFARLDRWIQTFREAGVTWIEGSHVAGRSGDWHSNFVWARFPILGADGKPLDLSPERVSEEDFEPFMKGFLQAIHAHLKERGWAERYVQHIADEPIPENMESWVCRARRVRNWLPGVPIIDAVMAEGLGDVIDIQAPQIQHIKPPKERNRKETFWSYVCLYPQQHYPNRFLDYPSIRNRILFWLSYSLDLKGFLHWGYNYWETWSGVPTRVDVSPWLDATGGSIYCADRQPLPAGDPFIVYPGRSQICSSIRWEVARKGMEDFEYLYLLDQAVSHPRKTKAKKSDLDEARRLLERVRNEIAVSPDNHTQDAELLLAIREQAGNALGKLINEK